MPRACHGSLFVLLGGGGRGGACSGGCRCCTGGGCKSAPCWRTALVLSETVSLWVRARALVRDISCVSTRARVQGSYCPGGGPIYACASGSTTTSTGATSSAACVRASLPPGSYAERCVPFRLPS